MTTHSLNTFAVAISQVVTHSVMDDSHWQLLGFSARPKRVAIMRAFVSDAILAWEDAVKKELACLALSEIAAWSAATSFPHRVQLLVRVIEVAIDGLRTPAWPTFSFASRDHAVAHFTQALPAYGFGDLNEHGKTFFMRTMTRVPRDQLPSWLVRPSGLTSIVMPGSLFPSIRSVLSEESADKTYEDDTNSYDYAILTAVRQLFGFPLPGFMGTGSGGME